MPRKPTLVLVPGAWHGPDTWGKVVSAMEAEHYKCVPVALPTTLGDVSANFSDDVRAVRDAIVAETTQGRNVVVVVHSYGGAVGSSAIKGLTPQQPSSQNENSGHVVGFFMVATGFMVSGVTFLDGLGGNPPPTWECDWEQGIATIKVNPKELFYHDLPSEEGGYWVGRLQKQALKAFTTGAADGYAGWKEVPVWYLATTEDKALPIEAQRAFVQGAQAEGGNVTLREIASSHSPMLSKPEETAKVLLEALEAFA
ncbi:Alpha/beta hydrolase fold-1 [Ilyonectria robusta]|uniref:Alpha/beta hydrolase fold-1 n=1 Tax=Ilyonectria robusta TaxID=1079257 RepID=UPI001E8D0858|nr:Alpha/beta hydrolase fold-1 [Ilyonectria robusta]KAH8661710.1 Alpha/beta hydrolase fold-1 [Ilyonectria robusta]